MTDIRFRTRVLLVLTALFGMGLVIWFAPISSFQPLKRDASIWFHRNSYLLNRNYLEDLVVGNGNNIPQWFGDWGHFHLFQLVELDYLEKHEFTLTGNEHDGFWKAIGGEGVVPDSYCFFTYQSVENDWCLEVYCEPVEADAWVAFVASITSD